MPVEHLDEDRSAGPGRDLLPEGLALHLDALPRFLFVNVQKAGDALDVLAPGAKELSEGQGPGLDVAQGLLEQARTKTGRGNKGDHCHVIPLV